ncbi:MAG: hypothetical protein UW11_C0012G0003 [Parcubacteria group bacterium GW2011_GWA2_43_9b]|uniref:Uncharacterized protein n=1 Tax=Candidatus Portnoybacteria bacterium RIFCSPLOWO2_02_FULL_39_11 TaxID=1802001 RepID=A0A1G2FRW2_9BACT|nr:MAG: hypothetical protein UW11_C0012G0003 [Parcubacteria group bacterium GW2011_GWA2_43_9b]OGZ40472.1 MAG: hypothetical protein A3B04_01540 [Candidatus Portnoybacteria bacterium RIFCSPLOWO2_02_FULL_39_11]
MAVKMIKLVSGIRIGVDDEGEFYGLRTGDILLVPQCNSESPRRHANHCQHAKWCGKLVEVKGFYAENKVLWGQVVGEETCDCTRNPEGLKLARVVNPPACRGAAENPHLKGRFIVKKSVKKNISPQKLERMWKKVNLSCLWIKVVQSVSREADAFERARAKSKEKAASTVFI